MFFWLTSLGVIGSSLVHLIRTDSNMFFLQLSNSPLCRCNTAFLSIRLLMDITIERMHIILQCKVCPCLYKFSLLFWLSIYTNSSSLHWSTLFPYLLLWLLMESFSEFLLWHSILKYIWIITLPCFQFFHCIALCLHLKKFNLASHKLCRNSSSPTCCWLSSLT